MRVATEIIPRDLTALLEAALEAEEQEEILPCTAPIPR
jgi:hypothetical protein